MALPRSVHFTAIPLKKVDISHFLILLSPYVRSLSVLFNLPPLIATTLELFFSVTMVMQPHAKPAIPVL